MQSSILERIEKGLKMSFLFKVFLRVVLIVLFIIHLSMGYCLILSKIFNSDIIVNKRIGYNDVQEGFVLKSESLHWTMIDVVLKLGILGLGFYFLAL